MVDRRKRDLLALLAYDPGLGPMTPATMGGRPNAELRQGDLSEPPSTLETALQYGSFPARMVWDEFDRSAKALERGVMEGHAPSLAEAGVRTLMLAGKPVSAALSAAGAYGGFSLYDDLNRPANAVDRAEVERRLRSMPAAEVRRLQQELDLTPDGRVGPDTIGAMVRREEDLERRASRESEERVAIESARAQAEAEAAARAKVEQSSDVARRVDEAKEALFKELTLARAPTEDTTLTGQLYDQLGILAPFLGGVAGGAAARMAIPYVGTSKWLGPNAGTTARTATKLADDYAIPALAGAEIGGSIALAPLNAEANRADPTNPEYRAWQRYALNLPEEAQEEIARAEARLQGPDAVPRIDPSVTSARESLADGWTRAGAMMQGALGGTFGNFIPPAMYETGRQAARLPGMIAEELAEVPGRASAGSYRGQAAAEAQREAFNRAKAQADAASRSKKGDRPDQPDRPDDPGGGGRGGDRSGGRDRNRETGGGGGGGSGGDGGKKDRSTRGPRGPAYTDEARAAARGYLADRVEAGGNNITREGLEEAITTAGQRVPQGFDNMADRTIKFLNAVEHAGGRVDRNTIMNMPTTLGRGAPLLGVPLAVGALSDEEQRRALIEALSE